MSVPRHSRPHVENRETLGLVANGTSGQWDVAVDETTSGADRWFVQIEGPTVSFYFEIASPDMVEKMLQFLEYGQKKSHNKSTKGNGLLLIGKDKRMPVTLVRDDEDSDRIFLLVGPQNRPIVRFAVVGADLTSLIGALRQAMEDLEES
jgi:hypothetical protein